MIFFLWTHRRDYAHSILCSLLCSCVLLLPTFSYIANVIWLFPEPQYLQGSLCYVFLFQFNELTRFRIELQCKFVASKASLWSVSTCFYCEHKKVHVLSFVCISFYIFLRLSLVLRAWDTLYFRGQRGEEAVVLKIPLFACSVHM